MCRYIFIIQNEMAKEEIRFAAKEVVGIQITFFCKISLEIVSVGKKLRDDSPNTFIAFRIGPKYTVLDKEQVI